ncbi:MOXD1 1 [Tetrabaena socialis]|uniref:MOXD1 1 n=1 Tax=Tetrabaena socialis TaxID=47790 RepID=A0A2J7ZK78_9CHLO|nr:MOXD1 1 [Tetrabaena socialis]|eukprot:PNH00660.1 MOXD1 1 [Tetrabaena socialis]
MATPTPIIAPPAPARPSGLPRPDTSMRSLVQSPLIHHIVLFFCDRKPPPRSGVFDCLGPTGGEGCSQPYLIWTPGQMQSLLPPTVGLPMGEPDSTYYSLQARAYVHYNNPDALEGVVDASGLEVLYTPQLRQYDAGVLTLGQRAITIPPGRPIVTLKPNVCPSSCTSRLRTPLRLLSAMVHMHTLGRAIHTQHIRNGTELAPVASRRFYNFDFQSQEAVPLASSLLLPGDSLITTCSYDSTSRTNVTTYGESTQSEMCFTFVLYYPRDTHFTACSSMDMAGDPSVALCGGAAEAEAVDSALRQLQQQQQQSGPKAGAVAAPPSATLNMTALPVLAPLFRSGALVRVPPNDTVYAKPYGRQCPDMSYGLPLQEQREMALRAMSDDGP